MTVAELIESLKELDPSIIVLTPEGGDDTNYYSAHPCLRVGWFRRGTGQCEFYTDDDDEYESQVGDVRAVTVE